MTYPIFYLKKLKNGKVVHSVRTSKKMRISRLIKLMNFKNERYDTVYIQIRYSKDYDNEGYYTNQKDLHLAYRAFLEVIDEF